MASPQFKKCQTGCSHHGHPGRFHIHQHCNHLDAQQHHLVVVFFSQSVSRHMRLFSTFILLLLLFSGSDHSTALNGIGGADDRAIMLQQNLFHRHACNKQQQISVYWTKILLRIFVRNQFSLNSCCEMHLELGGPSTRNKNTALIPAPTPSNQSVASSTTHDALHIIICDEEGPQTAAAFDVEFVNYLSQLGILRSLHVR